LVRTLPAPGVSHIRYRVLDPVRWTGQS
jgi:hypothetical protein